MKFWKDRWCDDEFLEEAFLEVFSLTTTKDAWVDQVWEQRGEGGFTRQVNDLRVRRGRNFV